jgi:hypothetical protein
MKFLVSLDISRRLCDSSRTQRHTSTTHHGGRACVSSTEETKCKGVAEAKMDDNDDLDDNIDSDWSH